MHHFVSMKAAKSFTYASRRLAVDEVFNAHRKHARVLEAIGKAKTTGIEAGMVPEKPPVSPTAPARAVKKPKAPKKAKATEKPAKAYKRRDIKPGETK